MKKLLVGLALSLTLFGTYFVAAQPSKPDGGPLPLCRLCPMSQCKYGKCTGGNMITKDGSDPMPICRGPQCKPIK